MPLHLDAGTLVNVAVLAGIVAGPRAVASVLQTLIEQISRTRRLNKALEGSRPNQRPEIIKACSQLEGTPGRKPGASASDRALPANGRPRAALPDISSAASPSPPRSNTSRK